MRFLPIVLYIFLFIKIAPAQWMQFAPADAQPLMPVLQDSLYHHLNFYDMAQNPAALLEDEYAPALWAGNFIRYAQGKNHLPLSPATRNNQNYSVQVVRPLSARDVFKGYFGYHRATDQSVKWTDQSRLSDLNPFILADSSTGTFSLNGLYWSGEWAHRLSKNLLTGVSFYYNVDQRLKQNFPKPENDHRDFNFRLGGQYTWKKWKFGASYRYFSEQEKVEITRYNLDQNMTPYLFKFRFSDLPIILAGKTSEERKIDYRGHHLDVEFSRPLGRNSFLMGALGYNSSRGNVEDGGTERQLQGTFEAENWLGRVILHRSINKSASLRISYTFRYQMLSANHPDFNFRIMEEPSARQQIIFSLKRNATPRTKLFMDLGYANAWRQFQDFITVNYYEYRYHQFLLRLGAARKLSSRWEFQIWSGLNRFLNYGSSRSDNAYSEFFNVLMIDKFRYYTNQKVSLNEGLRLTYHYGPLLDVELTGQYSPEFAGDRLEGGSSREEWLLSVWLKLFIF